MPLVLPPPARSHETAAAADAAGSGLPSLSSTSTASLLFDLPAALRAEEGEGKEEGEGEGLGDTTSDDAYAGPWSGSPIRSGPAGRQRYWSLSDPLVQPPLAVPPVLEPGPEPSTAAGSHPTEAADKRGVSIAEPASSGPVSGRSTAPPSQESCSPASSPNKSPRLRLIAGQFRAALLQRHAGEPFWEEMYGPVPPAART